MATASKLYVAFQGNVQLGIGSLDKVVTLCFESKWEDQRTRIAVYEDESGQVVDVNLSGTLDEVLARIASPEPQAAEASEPTVSRKPGRPKLGVVSREISLLPRHWDWLSEQRGGASATLRRLVELAKKNDSIQRRIVESAHRFLWDIAGDQPNFEEVSRALFAANFGELTTLSAEWPEGIRH